MKVSEIMVKPNCLVRVNGNTVWDFKVQDQTLQLISEKVEGWETFEPAMLQEIQEYLKSLGEEVLDFDIADETTEKILEEQESSRVGELSLAF